MPTPFPGMDPYLEHPSLWPNVHSSLIVALRDVLFAARPDVSDEIREIYLEIRAVPLDRVITVIEVLLHTNKHTGQGRWQYDQKRLALTGTRTHFVEIDLLRAGQPMVVPGYQGQSDYRILISHAERRPQADLLPFNVRQPIPSFHLPLVADDDEPAIDLNGLLHALYDRAGYDLRIDYRGEPEPTLPGPDGAWAHSILQAAELR